MTVRRAALAGAAVLFPLALAALASSTTARVSQEAVEVLYRPTSTARVSQVAIECLVGPVPADTDFTPYAELI